MYSYLFGALALSNLSQCLNTAPKDVSYLSWDSLVFGLIYGDLEGLYPCY